MARIEGLSRNRTLVARLAFFLSRRSYGRVIVLTFFVLLWRVVVA